MGITTRLLLLMLLPVATQAAEPRLPAPEPVKGSLLEKLPLAEAGDSRFDFRLQDLGAVEGPLKGSRIHKMRDFENRVSCYLFVPEGTKPSGGSMSCVKD